LTFRVKYTDLTGLISRLGNQMELITFSAPCISPDSIYPWISLMGPNKKWPTIRTTAIRYKINEGQKLVVTFTKMARASIKTPSKRRYLIIIFRNFIKWSMITGEQK